MAGFSFNPQLFNSAIKKMESAESSFSGINGLISDVSSKFPKNYEYKSIVSTACDDLSVASTFVSNYIKTLNHTNEDLAEKFLDPTSNIKNSDLLDHLGDIFSDTGAFWQGKVFSSLRGDILNYINLLKMTGATILVFDTTVLGAVANVGEAIFDGVYAISAFSGAAGAKLHDYFYGTNTSSQIMDETLDFLRRDLSGEAKEKIFSTKVGQAINKQSVLKYDSEVANKIEQVSEFTAKVTAAVVATVFTGGAASVAFGALYGAGNKLENYANKVDRENGENYNYTEAILKGASGGVTGAMEWWGYGGLGSFALNGVKALSAFKAAGGSLSLSGIRNAALLIRKSVALRDFGKNYFKELFAKDNIIDSGSVITDDLLDYYYGDITKAELVKDVKSELSFAALFSSIGALGRVINDAKIQKSFVNFDTYKVTESKVTESKVTESKVTENFYKSVKESIIIDKSSEFWKLNINGKSLNMNKKFLVGYVNNRETLARNLDFLLDLNNISIQEFTNALHEEVAYKLEKAFRGKKEFSKVRVESFNGYPIVNNLERDAVYLLTVDGNSYRLHTDELGTGRIFAFDPQYIYEKHAFDFLFKGDNIDFKYLGKKSDVYDLNNYKSRLKYSEGIYGVDQGCCKRNLEKMSKAELDKVYEIIHKNIPWLNENDIFSFAESIDADAGVCSYAAPLNSFIQNNKIIFDEKIFRDCFGFDFINKETGKVNAELLLIDMYSYINRQNYDIFKYIDGEWRFSSSKLLENQVYLTHGYGPEYYDGVKAYKNHVFMNYYNSRLNNGIKKYGYNTMKKYRITLKPEIYFHSVLNNTPKQMYHDRIDVKEPLYGKTTYSLQHYGPDIIFDNMQLVDSMKEGELVLSYYPLNDKTEEIITLPMFKIDGSNGSEWHILDGGHDMNIVDYTGDGLIVQSWGNLYYIDKTALESGTHFLINGYNYS